MTDFKFCEICGRITPCKWHDGKEEKPKLKKQPRFSGKSDYVKENGIFNGTRGR